MRLHRLFAPISLIVLVLPGLAVASVTPDELPASTRWYLHADLAEMRDSEVGRELYRWLDDEIFGDLRNDLGVDLGAETDRVTLFSQGDDDAVLAIRGRFSDKTREKVLALAQREAQVDEHESDGAVYYQLGQMDDVEFDGYFTFAVDGLLLFTSEAATMERLLANGGRVEEREAADGTLLILTADRDLMQAGLRQGAGEERSWDSRILDHTREAAFLVADRDGLASLEGRIVATDPRMALAVSGIVGGLIGLQALAAEEEPALAELLGNTRVTVNEGTVGISALVEPEVLVQLLAN